MQHSSATTISEWLRRQLDCPQRLNWCQEILLALCAVDTSLGADLDRLRTSEGQCFRIIADVVRSFGDGLVSVSAIPIEVAELQDDTYFTPPFYAGKACLDLARVYQGRGNVLLEFGTPSPTWTWVLNAHIDTVPPHIHPSRKDELVFGRGSVDNKAGIVTALLLLRLICEHRSRYPTQELPNIKVLVVIDEEMGGNGSLIAARKIALNRSTVVVLEPTELVPHPGNRGALWFAVKLHVSSPGLQRVLLDAGLAVVSAIGQFGTRLRTNYPHPLFASEDVQTCFGIFENVGTLPSSALTELSWTWDLPCTVTAPSAPLLQGLINTRLSELEQAGKVRHRARAPRVSILGSDIKLTVYSLGGHMGSRSRDTDALIKSSHIIGLFKDLGLGVPKHIGQSLCIEGGQGFLPSVALGDVKNGIRSIVLDAVEHVCKNHNLPLMAVSAEVSFDKLHNEAYCNPTGALGAPRLAAAIAEIQQSAPIELRGWQVSCDARIFARSCKDVVTFGPGSLNCAHSDEEHVDTRDIVKAASALFISITSDGVLHGG